MIEFLVQRGVDINITNNNSESAIFIALKEEKINACLCLIQNGSDLEQRDSYGISALELIFLQGDETILKTVESTYKQQVFSKLKSTFTKDRMRRLVRKIRR